MPSSPTRPPFIVSTSDVPETTHRYPNSDEPMAPSRAIGRAAGLLKIGLHVKRVPPGHRISWPHAESHEEEFVYVLEGEITLVEDGGETLLKPGDAAGWKAGVANGHMLVNKSSRDAVYLEIGSRLPRERAHYPDYDLLYTRDENGIKVTHRDGKPY